MWLLELLVQVNLALARADAHSRRRAAFLASLAGLAGVVSPITAARAQSFDCRYARYLDEKTIFRD